MLEFKCSGREGGRGAANFTCGGKRRELRRELAYGASIAASSRPASVSSPLQEARAADEL